MHGETVVRKKLKPILRHVTKEIFLRRKWTLSAHGRQVIFVKNPIERTEHVLMKAFIWALYLPQYPELRVEVQIGDRYKPDVVQLDAMDVRPTFWGEAGVVGKQKIASLTRRFRTTHFAMGKWNANLHSYEQMVGRAIRDLKRSAPFDLIRFPPDSAEKFISSKGEITITHDDVEWIRIE